PRTFNRYRRASSSSSWARATAFAVTPPLIIRASSAAFSPSLDSSRTVTTLRPSRPGAFSTTRWWSAKDAIWARCVTTSTWWRAPRALSRSPTWIAASPPIPASTSSNTSVGIRSASAPTVLMASMTRASSPPGRDPGERRERLARVGGEHHLGGLAARGRDLGERPQRDLEAGALEAKALELGGHCALHASRGANPGLRKPGRRRLEVAAPSRPLRLRRHQCRLEIFGRAQLHLEALPLLERSLDRAAVLALDRLELGEPRLDG